MLERLGFRVVLAGCAALALVPGSAFAAPAAPKRAQAEQTARATVAAYRAQAAVNGPIDCVGSAGDPAPGNQAWTERDYVNQYCATERLQDEYGNPAFGTTFWAETPAIYAGQTLAMLT